MNVNHMPIEKHCDAKIQSFIKEYGFDENKEFRVSILLMELAKSAHDNKLINDNQLEEFLLMAKDLNDSATSYCSADTISQLIQKYEFDKSMIFQLSEHMDKIASILYKNDIITLIQSRDIEKIANDMSIAFNPCSRTKIYQLKTNKETQEMQIDEELDSHLLDLMNANKNIEIETIEAGHDCPTQPRQFYMGNFPEIGFNYIGNLPIVDVKETLNKIPNAKVMYDRQTIRVADPKTGKRNIFGDIEIDTIIGYENLRYITQDYFFIRGTHKGDQKWWKNVAKILSTLK